MEIISQILGLLGGVSVIITALLGYLGKLLLQDYRSQLEANKERLKALLDRANYVSKARFDAEFGIYKEIWSSLVPLRQSTMSLRPTMDFFDLDEPTEERMKRRLKLFSEAFVAYREVVEKHEPFYEVKIHESLIAILKLCDAEAVDYKYKDEQDAKEYWNSQTKNHENIKKEIENCCELIRKRIHSMSVFEE